MTLGEKLQALRVGAGLSQEGLAERLTVSRQAVSKWELDKTVPDVKYIVALSELFQVSTDYLLKEDVPAPEKQPTVPPPAGAPPPEPASIRPWYPASTACRVLEIGNVLAASLLAFYLPLYLFNFARPGLWPLAVAAISPPVLLSLARMLLAGVEIPPPVSSPVSAGHGVVRISLELRHRLAVRLRGSHRRPAGQPGGRRCQYPPPPVAAGGAAPAAVVYRVVSGKPCDQTAQGIKNTLCMTHSVFFVLFTGP